MTREPVIDPEMYELLKKRAKGEIPNVPWRQGESARQRAERWNSAWPNDPIPVPDEARRPMSELPEPTEDDLSYVAEAMPDALLPGDPTEVRYVVAALIAGERGIYRKAMVKLIAQVEARLIAAGDDEHRQAALARSIPSALRAFVEQMQ